MLAGVSEQVVDHVLKAALLLAELLGSLRIAGLQLGNHAVANVHLIVQILALQMIQLEVEQASSPTPDDGQHLPQHAFLVGKHLREAAVERADHVVANPAGVLGHHFQLDALEHVAGELAALGQAFHHLVNNGALALPVDAAEDVHPRVQLPHDVLLPAPEGINFDALDVVSKLLHSGIRFLHRKNTTIFATDKENVGKLFPMCASFDVKLPKFKG